MVNLKELLKKSNKFSTKNLPRSFDVVGSVALIQIPKQLEKHKKFIANLILKTQKNINSVYQKGKHKGRLRKQVIKWIAGKKVDEVIHKESGCLFKFNIKTCYFSPRLGTDRLEIAKKVKKKEKVLVMFAGVGPYGIIIAKRNNNVTCIELGKEACRYAKENSKMNKVNLEVIQGDVKKVCPKLKKKFDRIIMARPQLKDDFLKEALLVSKKGTIIHFYDFLEGDFKEKIKKKLPKKIKLIRIKKVREIAPYKYHVRADFRVL
ncbi:MAG: methyltransferase domain-containing protein [archaeon]|nr:MAG: methyltransferase domain-containing protein [archaeon]